MSAIRIGHIVTRPIFTPYGDVTSTWVQICRIELEVAVRQLFPSQSDQLVGSSIDAWIGLDNYPDEAEIRELLIANERKIGEIMSGIVMYRDEQTGFPYMTYSRLAAFATRELQEKLSGLWGKYTPVLTENYLAKHYPSTLALAMRGGDIDTTLASARIEARAAENNLVLDRSVDKYLSSVVEIARGKRANVRRK